MSVPCPTVLLWTNSSDRGHIAPGTADPGADEPWGPALLPSRAADFMTCPLLYRLGVIDRLTRAAAKHT